MDEIAFKRRFVRTFYDSQIEILVDKKRWTSVSKGSKDRLLELDKAVNEWLVDVDALLISITPTTTILERSTEEREVVTKYLVVYEPTSVDDSEIAITTSGQKLLPAVPLTDGAVAPAVEVTYEQDGAVRKAYAMAGICGVPEGAQLHPDDTEFALVPLFSPDLDLLVYRDLFFNIERANDHVRSVAAA